MKLEELINSRAGMAMGMVLARLLPPGPGHWLASRVGGLRGRLKKNAQVRAVRANQWVISGQHLNARQVDEMARRVYRSTARSLYDLYRNMNDPQAVLDMVHFEPSFEYYLKLNLAGRQGILFVCAHLTNFDFIGRAAGLRGIRMQILSYPNPAGGYRWQNEMRKIQNLRVTPMSVEALRQAVLFLRAGGAVVTGIDRPIADQKYCPVFFDRPAPLPVGHVRLALKVHLPVVVLSGSRRPDGTYVVRASDPIEMRPHPNLHTEIIENAERILHGVEDSIRAAPDQWAMFYPVWQSALTEVPV
jgi:phosphatidylinositol dimannoside acyltransferase